MRTTLWVQGPGVRRVVKRAEEPDINGEPDDTGNVNFDGILMSGSLVQFESLSYNSASSTISKLNRVLELVKI